MSEPEQLLFSAYDELTKSIDALHVRLQEKSEIITALKSQNEQIEQLLQEKQQLEQDLANLQQTLQSQMVELVQLQQIHQNQMAEHSRLQLERDNLNKQLEDIRSNVTACQRDRGEEIKKIVNGAKQLAIENAQNQIRLVQLQANLDNAEKQLKQKDEQINTLQLDVSNHQIQMNRLQVQIADVQQELTKIQIEKSEKEKLEQQMGLLGTNIESLKTSLVEARTMVEQYRLENENLVEAQTQKTKDLENLTEQNKELNAKLQQVETLRLQAMNSVRQIGEKLSNVSNEVVSVRKDLETTAKERDELKVVMQQTRGEINTCKQQLDEFGEMIRNQRPASNNDNTMHLMDTIKKLNMQLESAKQDIVLLRQHISQQPSVTNVDNMNLEQEIVKLRAENVALTDNQRQLAIDKHAVETQLAATLQQFQETKQQLVEAQQQNQQLPILQNQIAQLQQTITSRDLALQNLQAQLVASAQQPTSKNTVFSTIAPSVLSSTLQYNNTVTEKYIRSRISEAAFDAFLKEMAQHMEVDKAATLATVSAAIRQVIGKHVTELKQQKAKLLSAAQATSGLEAVKLQDTDVSAEQLRKSFEDAIVSVEKEINECETMAAGSLDPNGWPRPTATPVEQELLEFYVLICDCMYVLMNVNMDRVRYEELGQAGSKIVLYDHLVALLAAIKTKNMDEYYTWMYSKGIGLVKFEGSQLADDLSYDAVFRRQHRVALVSIEV